MLRIYQVPPIILQFFIRLITRALFYTLAHLEVRGVEHVLNAPAGPLIFASNHSSEWDGPLIRSCLPMIWRGAPMYYVSMVKEKYTESGWRQYIYGGVLFNLLGAYPVYSGKRDYAYALQNHINILNGGGSLCIFPEGARTKDGTLGKPRGGVAYLAHITQAPVIPVAVTGLACLTMRDFFTGKRHVTVTFGKPLWPQKLFPRLKPDIEPSIDEVHTAAEHIFDKVSEQFAAITHTHH
jgi:1-acyl-sn-glycerol-3-phosphate acyltransferase